MSAGDDARHGGLEAVLRLEAERLLADARAAGADAGRRRRAAILADAEAEASAIRADGETVAGGDVAPPPGRAQRRAPGPSRRGGLAQPTPPAAPQDPPA